jgi:class 3 adenylate cyclase
MPETRYARAADGTHIAYQVTGSGPVDILLLRAWVSALEHEWQDPVLARAFRRLEATGRLIRLDRRGSGLSDRVHGSPTIEDRLDDIRAVLDAVGSRSAVLIGLAAGGRLCAMFAAAHPDRTAGLVLYEADARGAWAPDYPWGERPEDHQRFIDDVRTIWGTEEMAGRIVRGGAPSRADDRRFVEWLAEDLRQAMTPSEAVLQTHIDHETDIRAALPAIHVPTLVVSRRGGAEPSRDLAARIPGARYVELPGEDHLFISGDTDAVLREIDAFIAGLRDAEQESGDIDRVLTTVLFTDIVGSTAIAARMGDRRWTALLETHHGRARALLGRYKGRLVDTAGDGVFASFDGPARAIRCATAIVDDARTLGLEIRAAVHTGECEVVDGRLRGIAVHVGARIAALAGPSQVLVSGTVKDLVAGSELEFDDQGARELAGVPGEWRVLSVKRTRHVAPAT